VFDVDVSVPSDAGAAGVSESPPRGAMSVGNRRPGKCGSGGGGGVGVGRRGVTDRPTDRMLGRSVVSTGPPQRTVHRGLDAVGAGRRRNGAGDHASRLIARSHRPA